MVVFSAFFGCRGVVGFKVAMWLRHVREKVRPARPGVGASAKKFALQAQNGRKTLFSGALGEFFRARAVGIPVLGEFFRANRHYAQVLSATRALPACSGGGFALHEAVAQRVAGVSDPHVVQFPQSGGGEVGTRGGVVLTVQTASEKSVENGLLWATWSALWVHRCLS